MVTVSNGQPVLGQYQDVILVELDSRQRKVALQGASLIRKCSKNRPCCRWHGNGSASKHGRLRSR